MSCQYCERYLLYYLLGELSPRDRSRMEQHIRDCVTCSEELKVLARDLTLISEAVATRASAPDAMLADIRQRVAKEPPLAAARHRWLSTRLRPAHAMGMLAAFAAVALVTWFVQKPNISAAALVTDRQEFLKNREINSLTSGTPADAAQALARCVDAAVLAVQIRCDGLRFCGYTERIIKRCPVALLVYGNESRGDCVSVYEYPHRRCALANDLGERSYRGKSYRAGSINGTTAVAWQTGDTTIALVSDVPLDEALAQAEAARNSIPGNDASPAPE